MNPRSPKDLLTDDELRIFAAGDGSQALQSAAAELLLARTEIRRKGGLLVDQFEKQDALRAERRVLRERLQVLRSTVRAGSEAAPWVCDALDASIETLGGSAT